MELRNEISEIVCDRCDEIAEIFTDKERVLGITGEIADTIIDILPQLESIETAPKDGTSILTYAKFGGWSVRYWGDGDDGDKAWQPRIRGCFPSYWQPLPSEPKS